MASVQLIKYHAKQYKDEKVLKQRHRVCIIPIASVRYQWKKHEGLFYVYGNEKDASMCRTIRRNVAAAQSCRSIFHQKIHLNF
ncbi:protein SSUH2 [Caerostris extrusa]|uniref:Protein SSUH2 n=1 Tax=Caerostris extrusa TaxID=172846 RepID=A0AAV4NN18_CAEEX|nr:protein SSUH2 [Caerostris extrusa]